MESVSTNKPLYCFKMDSETHEIVKYIIDDYVEKGHGDNRFYVYNGDVGAGNQRYHVYKRDIDKVVNNNKVHSFESDPDYAIEIFKFHFNEKVSKCYSDYLKWNKICDLLDERYPGGEDGEETN